VTPATSFITEGGDLCRVCFAGFENEVDARRVADEIAEKRARGAVRNAHTHGVVWMGVGLLVAFSHFRREKWVAAVAFVLALALRRGLSRMSRVAFFAALGLDGAAALALLVVAAAEMDWAFIVVALFPALLFVLTWAVRGAYAK
jgi:hypothetical protein